MEKTVVLRYLVILVTSILFACGGKKHPPVVTISNTEALQVQYSKYLEMANYGWNAYGNMGDGLLFASLSAVAVNREFDVESARDEYGQWYRKPVDVFRTSPNSSTISRDMFMGLFVYALHFRRLDILQDVARYGRENGWVMGQEDKLFETRVIFTPATRSLLGQIIQHLGGPDSELGEIIPVPINTDPGFVSHLGMLQLLMLGKIQGYLTSSQKASLKQILTHSSQNPLAHALYHKYTDGDQSEATRLLLSIWPADRLPTSQDWCEEWRIQRSDNDTGFNPCNDKQLQHSGADFLFAAGVVLGHI